MARYPYAEGGNWDWLRTRLRRARLRELVLAKVGSEAELEREASRRAGAKGRLGFASMAQDWERPFLGRSSGPPDSFLRVNLTPELAMLALCMLVAAVGFSDVADR